MKTFVRSYVWWPIFNRDIEAEVSIRFCSCKVNSRSPPVSVLHPWEHPSGAWVRLQADYPGRSMEHMFLIVVDSYSECMEVVPCKSKMNLLIHGCQNNWLLTTV